MTVPPPSEPLTYAVHTEACTYLLDDGGVCRWIVSPRGLAPDGSSAAVGAQFVACLDLTEPGGLVAELRVGASALFVRPDDAGHLVLLRTSRISHIESRAGEAAPRGRPRPPAPRPSGDAGVTLTLQKPLFRPVPAQAPPHPELFPLRRPGPGSVSPPTLNTPSSMPMRGLPPPPPKRRGGTDGGKKKR